MTFQKQTCSCYKWALTGGRRKRGVGSSVTFALCSRHFKRSMDDFTALICPNSPSVRSRIPFLTSWRTLFPSSFLSLIPSWWPPFGTRENFEENKRKFSWVLKKGFCWKLNGEFLYFISSVKLFGSRDNFEEEKRELTRLTSPLKYLF